MTQCFNNHPSQATPAHRWRETMTFDDLDFVVRKGGSRAVCDFPNGYKASVITINNVYGDGLYELAVMHGVYLVYDTPVTDDVLGYLTPAEVTTALGKIAALPLRVHQ